MIQLYWKFIPASKRKKCIFRISCSTYIYQETKSKGFIGGVKAFRYRYQNCRNGFSTFTNPVDGTTQMLLPNHDVLKEDEIAERFLPAKIG